MWLTRTGKMNPALTDDNTVGAVVKKAVPRLNDAETERGRVTAIVAKTEHKNVVDNTAYFWRGRL